MSFVAAAVIGGIGLVGGAMQAGAARDAASAQSQAANRALDLQGTQYDQQRQDQAKWRQAGETAIAGMQDGKFQETFDPSKLQDDPGYQFRLQEGQKAINASAAARGMGNSGATLKSLARYGQDYASNEYTNAYNRFNNDRTTQFNRLSSLAGLGQTANGQLATAGMNYANQGGQAMMGAGNAQASGYIGQANALTGAINQGTNSWMQSQMMNRLFPPGGGTPTGGGGGGYGSAGQSYFDSGSMA